jgi:polysaccharide biosynthesis/export protein
MSKVGWGRLTFRPWLAVVLCLAFAGCSNFPAAAPTASELERSIDNLNYTLVNVDERVAAILQEYRRSTFSGRFKNRRYIPNNILHAGDIVAVSIYEVGGSSLFGTIPGGTATPASTGSGGTTTIPPQVIEADGTIMVPFVGRVNVAGRTPGSVGTEIQRLLEGKAVDPQVVVTLVSAGSNTATVGGDVNAPRPVPLTLRGERLLDVIAAAGGAKYPAYEVYVTVVRDGQVATVLLSTIVGSAAENILVRPNDQIFLTRYARTFAVLGATTRVSQYTFDTAKVSLAEAVARAGGPIDTIGDPGGIYLFRYEPAVIAEKILGKELAVSALASAATAAKAERDFIPILYRIDFRTAGGYFLSQGINMHDKDVVLVTNSEVTQLTKALLLVRGFTGIAYDLARQGNN